jgi:hypothetical protein
MISLNASTAITILHQLTAFAILVPLLAAFYAQQIIPQYALLAKRELIFQVVLVYHANLTVFLAQTQLAAFYTQVVPSSSIANILMLFARLLVSPAVLKIQLHAAVANQDSIFPVT